MPTTWDPVHNKHDSWSYFSEIATQYERITVVNMGWSNNEDLIVVTDIGSIYMYDFDGTPLSQSSATSEIQDSRVIEAKVSQL